MKCSIYLEHIQMQNGKIDKIWEILGSVPDPEIPVISVVELGVIRDVQLIKNEYIISATPTYSGCPAVKTFQDDIKEEDLCTKAFFLINQSSPARHGQK